MKRFSLGVRGPRTIDVHQSFDQLLPQVRDMVIDAGVLTGDLESDREAAALAIAAWLREQSIDDADAANIIDALVDELAGYGPLEPLLADASVTEIMVNGSGDVWVEINGRLQPTEAHFRHADHVCAVLQRLLLGTGRRIDEGSPMVDAHLADGSRLNAVLPPIAPQPLITIRRFAARRFTMDDLVDMRSVGPRLAAFLHAAILGRANILISGGTGAGKTTALAALAGLVPHEQRIVCIEDVAELRIDHPHCLAMECRPRVVEGVGAVDVRDLVKNALRMRPDRLVIGEVRGGEAADMVQALNTGHAGSLATVHANSASEALARIEAMIALTWTGIDSAVLRGWIGGAVDLVVQCERDASGRRFVQSICAVQIEDGGLNAVPVYASSGDEFVACGSVPTRCLERMAYHGVVFPTALFAEAA